MTNELNRVVTVALFTEGRTLAHDNMNVIALITSDDSVLNSQNRWIEVAPSEVETVFGSYSDVADWARVIAATKPNATQVGGKLVVGYHRAKEETIPEQMAKVIGGQIDEPLFLSKVTDVTDGEMVVTVGDTDYVIEGVDFSSVKTLDDVLTALDSSTAPVSFSLNNGRFIATAGEKGAIELKGEVASILQLTRGTGATITEYQEEQTLEPETRLDALSALSREVNFKGAAFIDRLLDDEIMDIAEWATGSQVLVYEVFNNEKYTTYDNDNPCWQVNMAGLKSFRMLWGRDRRYAAAYMARMHTVNFNGENTAHTMHLKELPIVAEPISDDLWTRLDRIGLDPYTTTKNIPNVLCSHGNGFVDDEYNLIAFLNHAQTDVYNLLKSSFTKLAQTEQDGDVIVDQLEKTSRRFVRAGFIAPGAWSNPNILGEREAFLRSIKNEGYYWQIGSFEDQPQSDRERRIAPVIQGAIKNAGAIHKVDILINWNK